MKKTNYFTVALSYMATLFLVCGCEKNNNNNFVLEDIYSSISQKYAYSMCLSPNDAIAYPEPWTQEAASEFSISQETLENTSTCGLLETFFNQPWLTLGPWNSTSNNLNTDGIDYFNSSIDQNDVIQELLKRTNAVEALSGKYLKIIESNDDLMASKPGNIQYLEMLLASDAVRSLLTEQQAEELMVLSLKMIAVKGKYAEAISNTTTRHILVSMLMYLNHQPFMNDACFSSGNLETWQFGYKICSEEDSSVEQYAMDYLKMIKP